MIFLEFAAQGVRGVAPAGGRATLRPGYNVVSADGATLRRLVEALLYPDPRDGDALPRAGGGPANAPMRAGLTLVGNDRNTYRLVRDFASGCQLHRFDAEKRSFSLVSQDLGEIGAFLRDTVGVPPPSRLSALLAVAAADLPSRQGAAAAPGPQRPLLTPEQARKRLDLLRVELAKAKIAEKAQYQIDGLQAQLFRLDEALKGGARVREGLEKAEAARAELQEVARVAADLGDADAKLAAFEKGAARREEAAAKVAAKREELAAVEERGGPRPFWTDAPFWAGAGGGLGIALIAGLGAAVFPDMRYVALLDIPAFGWAAWLALRWVGALEEQERTGRRRRALDEWAKKADAQSSKEATEIGEAVKALGLSSAAELKEALVRLADADAVVSEWRKRLSDWEATPEARTALAERERVEKGMRAAEAKLAADVGGFVRDVRSVESDIRRVEAEAAAAPAPAAPAAAPRPAGEAIRTLLERTGAELGGSAPAAARAVAQKASQTLSGLSFQRLQSIQVDDRGNVQVHSGGRVVPAMTLAAVDRDLVWLALKLAFVEHGLASGNLVAIAEDAFAGLSEGSRRFAARLLKQIAKPGQLLHATSDPSFREVADNTA